MKLSFMKKVLGLSALVLGLHAHAGVVVCDTVFRDVTLSSAEGACKVGDGNTALGHLNSDFSTLAPWAYVSGIDSGNGSNSLFSLTFLTGGYDKQGASGTWTIAPEFWAKYGSAVLSFHVGHGKIDAPDHFEFLVTPGAVSGQWSYIQTCGKETKGCGGGFSNMHLWGAGEPVKTPPPVVPVDVPEPASLLLFALGLLGLIYVRRASH